jgi:hypothetical protein
MLKNVGERPMANVMEQAGNPYSFSVFIVYYLGYVRVFNHFASQKHDAYGMLETRVVCPWINVFSSSQLPQPAKPLHWVRVNDIFFCFYYVDISVHRVFDFAPIGFRHGLFSMLWFRQLLMWVPFIMCNANVGAKS